MTEAGVGELVDFMPVSSSKTGSKTHRLVRMLRCIWGRLTFALDIAPRFDYGREFFETHLTEDGAVFEGSRTSMTVALIREPEDERRARTRVDAHSDVHAEVQLEAGEMRGLVLETGTAGPVRAVRVAEAWRLFDETVDFWEAWLGRSTYAGRWREAVNRSAITLKLMTYAPTGGLVAAPTAALPEQIGGERNWDYRYTWVRDASFSRLMSWVALDRGIRLATAHGRPAPLERWHRERDSIYRQIMLRGWSPTRQAFRQHYDTDVLDSSLLRMPTVGFITPTDPRWMSTLRAMDAELVTDSLVYRYDPAASPDGLRGSEGTFSLCTFAYVHSLARAGQLDKARMAFEQMLTYANHLGLYSEEIGLTGEQLGNFPQAFTHLALIDAAIILDRQLDLDPPALSTRRSFAPAP